MSRTFAPAQTAYLAARAIADLCNEEARAVSDAYDAFCEAETAGMTEEQERAWNAAQVANAQPNPVLVRQTAALDALKEAEDALINWSLDVALTAARTTSQRADVETCRRVGMRSYSGRPKLVDIAMRLDA